MGVLVGLLAAMIGIADAIAEEASSKTAQQPADYQTQGLVLDEWGMNEWAEARYWEQKLGPLFELAGDPRMGADVAERDAVFATAWQLRPKTITAETKILAIIPRQPTQPQSKDLAYQITFLPRTSGKKIDYLDALFVSEGPGVRPVAVPSPVAGAVPRLPARYSYAGFIKSNVDQYWRDHPEELRSILYWIGTFAPPKFNQILNTNVMERGARRPGYFQVSGTKSSSGQIQRLSIAYIGEAAPVVSPLPTQYNVLDVGDLQLEKLQAGVGTPAKAKLGVIKGIAELPADERLPAKYAIWQYFMRGVRNAEVDAIVPIPNKEKRALLTIRFTGNNDVSVQRVGEAKKGTSLVRIGDVRSVNGFKENSVDATAFAAWLKKRYPAVTPTGATLSELENSVTAEIQKRGGTPAWFKENYQIEIVPAALARARIPSSFKLDDQQLDGMRDFSPAELQMLEVAIEKMSDRLVSRLKGLQIVRQKASLELIGLSKKLAVDNPSEAGVAGVSGKHRLIMIFDSSRTNSDALFVGGLPGGKPEVADTALWPYAHELGHIVSKMPDVQAAFDSLVRKNNIKSVTWYAASKPKDEFFPEVFALYVCDPEWLKANRPDLFAWLETL